MEKNEIKQNTVLILVAVTLIALIGMSAKPISGWLEQRSTLINVLDNAGKLSIIVSAIAFLGEIPKWREREKVQKEIENIERARRQLDYWKAIDVAVNNQGKSWDARYNSYALRIALQKLAKECDEAGKHLQMHNLDISFADLSELNLSGIDFTASQFRYTDLSNASLNRANLSKTLFRSACLFGVDFSSANLELADFRDSVCDERTIFPDGVQPESLGAYLIKENAQLHYADLDRVLLWNAELSGASFLGARLCETKLEYSNLKGACFRGTYKMYGVRLNFANLHKADLTETNLEQARLRHATLTEVNFSGANLKRADLREAILCNANLNDADLYKALLQGADIAGADFCGVKNLTSEQIKTTKNWEKAIYDEGLTKELGLLQDQSPSQMQCM